MTTTPTKVSLDSFPVPVTSHVRSVFEAAAKVGLEPVELHDRYERVTVRFEKKVEQRVFYVNVTFDKRGYIRQAGGASPDANSWVISVSGSRHFSCSPARALDVLVNFTLPQYAKEGD